MPSFWTGTTDRFQKWGAEEIHLFLFSMSFWLALFLQQFNFFPSAYVQLSFYCIFPKSKSELNRLVWLKLHGSCIILIRCTRNKLNVWTVDMCCNSAKCRSNSFSNQRIVADPAMGGPGGRPPLTKTYGWSWRRDSDTGTNFHSNP